MAVKGAQPVAITDCLNLGNPEDPAVMWQLEECVKGLVDGCRGLGTPVTGGNVSLYNQTGYQNILPTPVIGMLGVLDDVQLTNKMAFANAGDRILMLGITWDEFGGSVYEDVMYDGHLGGLPPFPNFGAERAIGAVMQEAAQRRLVSSAHDLAEGGLAEALIECCLASGLGATIDVPEEYEPATFFFSETSARVIVSLPEARLQAFSELCNRFEVPFTDIGHVSSKPRILVKEMFALSLDKLREAHESTLPAALA